MSTPKTPTTPSNIRRFFMRGLALVLPTVLTLILLTWAYSFINDTIAAPINQGLRWGILWATPYPHAVEGHTRSEVLEAIWSRYALGLNLIGLVIAVAIVLLAGASVGSFLGRRVMARGEVMLQHVPVFKQIYPSIKQITDMVVGQGGDQKIKFHRVVAVEFPRRDSWVIGLVTGPAIQPLNGKYGKPCINVFIPNTPTPISGFVLMVPEDDTIALSMSIEEALRFVVSAGLLLPDAMHPPEIDIATSEPPESPDTPETIKESASIPGLELLKQTGPAASSRIKPEPTL